MKTLLSLSFALCGSIFFISCSSTSPTAPTTTTQGVATPVGTPVGSPTTATIDASGGSLMSPDGRLEIIIPPNALSAATPLSIQPVTNEAPLGAGIGFSLTPNGLQFSQPVTLRFHYQDSDRAGTDVHALGVATQKDNRIWYSFNTMTLDTVTNTLSVATKHFSAYSLFSSFRVSPDHAEIKVNASQVVTVLVASKATVDDDPNDDLAPLGSFVTYPNANQVKWTVNGNTLGVTEDGLVSPTSGSSTTTYTAPAATDLMASNPAAVTAEVDLAGPSKLYLISNIKVTNGPAVSGRITLSVTLTGSQTYTHGEVETKTEDGSADFVYNLSDTVLRDDGQGDRSANWDDAAFGGTARWVEEHVSTYNYICDNVKDRQVTDKETTTQTFSSASAGAQKTGAGLSIAADGSYSIGIGPSTLPAATTVSTKEYSGYCVNPAPETYTNQAPIPFSQYFLPFVGGGGDKTTGKIDPADPNHIKGVYHGTDQYVVFSYNTTDITLPIEYTITWDLTLTK